MHKTNNHPHSPAPLRPNSWLAHAWHSAQQFKSSPQPRPYIGRFAPSPSGFLHQGSLIAALASYVHATWHGGEWLVRVEDVDRTRCTQAHGEAQLHTLRTLGFEFNPDVMWQSQRDAAYQAAFEQLKTQHRIYPCTCTRREIADSHVGAPAQAAYAGTCRNGIAPHKPIRSWRFRVDNAPVTWHDEMGMVYSENLEHSTGDFVIQRVDGDWAYQLAVVVDDAAQGVTHVVRGEDLLDSTARQIALQRALNLPTPVYNHFPLLLSPDGHKLSKRDQAPALDALHGLDALQHAWAFLGGQAVVTDGICGFWHALFKPPPK